MAIADDFTSIARKLHELYHGPKPAETDKAEGSLPCGVPPPVTKAPRLPPVQAGYAVHCKVCSLNFTVSGQTPFPASCPKCGASCG